MSNRPVSLKVISCFVAMVMMIAVCPVISLATADSLPDSLFYARSQLAKDPKAEEYLYAYDVIKNGIENFDDEIWFDVNICQLNADEIQRIFLAYRNDNPQHFWFGTNYTIYRYQNGNAAYIVPTYSMDKNEADSKTAALNKAVSDLLEQTDGMTEDELLLFLHDWLAANVVYDDTNVNAHNSYGALVDRAAVCDGYSRAYQWLLYQKGIQSYVVTGYAFGDALTGNHAWNLVQTSHGYTYIDITFDAVNGGDMLDHVYHSYYFMSTELISADHDFDELVDLPVCTYTGGYEKDIPHVTAPYSANDVGRLLSAADNHLHVCVDDDVEAFEAWTYENLADICRATGMVKSFRFRSERVGNEFVMMILAPLGDISGDYDINSSDILEFSQVMIGVKKYSGNLTLVADMDGDGIVTVSDYHILKLALLGMYELK